MPEDGLYPQLCLLQEEARLLDPDEVPALKRGYSHGRRFHPPPLEVAATVGGHYQAYDILSQQNGPEYE